MGDVHVFIDVDGVINAVHFKTPPGWAWPDEATVGANGFGIRYSPTLVKRLNAMAARPHVHMHWLTTWEHDAPQKLAPEIGLAGEDWPVVGTEHHYSRELTHGWWKHQAIRDALEQSQVERAVWIDDDIGFDSPAQEWLANNTHVLWVSPACHKGLTPDEMDRIEAYVGETA